MQATTYLSTCHELNAVAAAVIKYLTFLRTEQYSVAEQRIHTSCTESVSANQVLSVRKAGRRWMWVDPPGGVGTMNGLGHGRGGGTRPVD